MLTPGVVLVAKEAPFTPLLAISAPDAANPSVPAFDDNRHMDRSVARIPKRQQAVADLAYWLSRPMAERIAAVEALRLQGSTAGETAHAEPRLQRVCRVARRAGR